MSNLPEIKGYRIIEKIGSGGLASVYKATDPDQRMVALKVLSSKEPEDIERFKQEFMLLSDIDHPHIVRVYDFGYTSETDPYFSMEFIQGQDFRTCFEKSDHQKFYALLLQICQTLEFLHNKGVIHADIKPSNILVTEDDYPEVKFTDFGFAEFGKAIDFIRWKGTIPYMAPEIIRGETYTHQADLYSLGVTLYEALTGELPFKEKDLMDLAKAHLEQEPEFPQDSEIPEDLKEIILRMLKRDPIDRYYSTAEVMRDLKKLINFSSRENEILLGKSLITSVRFTGREKELSLLVKAFQKTQSCKSQIILLKGELGIGKTRILKEFKKFVQLNKGNVIWKDSPDINKTLLANIPGFGKESFPLVLIVDDLQNSSTEAIDLLIDFFKQIRENGILLCLVLEEEFIDSDKDRKESGIEPKIKLVFKNDFSEMVLQPLTKAESKKLVDSIFKWKQGAEEIAELVYEKTGGSPFLTLWSMRFLVEQGYLTKVNDFWKIEIEGFEKIELPEAYSLRVTKKLNHLSPDSINLLRLASVLGAGLNSTLLIQISGYSEKRVKECLEEIFQEKILKPEITSDGERLAFINGLVRNLIYKGIKEEDKKNLHGISGKALEKYYSDNPEEIIDELARHFIEAGKKELAFKYSYLAGEKAERENKHEKAIKHYRNTVRLFVEDFGSPAHSKEGILEKLARQYEIAGNYDKALSYYSEVINYVKPKEQSLERIAMLYKRMGVIYFRKGDYDKAIEVLKEGLSICSESQFPKVSAELNTALGWAYQRKVDFSQAVSCFQRAIGLLGKKTSKELGLSLNGLGVVYWELGEFNKAFNCYQKSLKIFEELKDESGLATVNMNLGLLSRSRGKPQEALNYFAKSLRLEQKYGNIANLSFLYNNLALVWENLYEWDKSLKYHLKSYELKEKMGDHGGLAITLSNLGLVHLRRGTLNKSLENHGEALRLFQNLKEKEGVAHSCFSLGEVYLLKGDWAESKNYLERSLRLRQESSDRSGTADSLCLLGRLNLETDNFAKASSQLRESLKLYDSLGNKKMMLEVSLALTDCGLRQKNTTEAEVHLNYAEKLLKSVEDQVLKGKFKRVTGALLIQRGRIEESLREFLEAGELFKRLKMRYEVGKTYLEIGKIKSEQGKFKEARGYLKEALTIFEDMEIPSRISECEGLMKKISDLNQIDQQRVKVLYQVSDLLNDITDLDELLISILDLTIEHLSAERAAVILYYPEDNSLELKAARGIETETKEDAISISRRVIKDVLKTDAPLIIEDARSDPEVSLYKSVIIHNILSILCVPLTTKNKTLGTIYVDHRSLSGMFTREDSDFLKAFANLIAVAIEKAQLYNELNEEVYQLKKDLRKTYSYPNIIGKSKKMQEVFRMVEMVANSKTSILLLGESGTGKELIANLIHHTSTRKDKPFVRVNCAALPESILESELFGVEEKVATGVAMREGKFKQAAGGTIFFDEIGDMSLSTQAKVLRVLQEREFERVGGSKTIKVDIRVISATNKDLEECIKKTSFRKDLFYRLNPVTIIIPPLRERKEDIPYLTDYFSTKFSQENKKPKLEIPVKVMKVLIDYPWSGNVRELANLMERAVLFSEDGFFPKEYLPSKAQIQRDIRILSSKESLTKVLDNTEKKMVLSALEKSNWNQVKAAFYLGISEASLRRKIAKYKIKKPRDKIRQK